MDFVRRHATGCTIILFLLGVLGLSAAPLPSWLRPLDAFERGRPVAVLANAIFRRPDSVPRKGDVAAADWVAVGDPGASGLDDDVPKPEMEIVRARERRAWKKPVRPKLELYRKKLNLAVAPLDNPCVEEGANERDGQPCGRRALDRFFRGLARAAEEEDGAPHMAQGGNVDRLQARRAAAVRVIHYGDSIIASDHITDMVRLRLQERFGSAGKGLLLVTRYNERQRRLRTGDGTEGWRAEHIAQSKLPDRYFGYAGASFTADKAGTETVFGDIGLNRYADIYYLAVPGGGALEVYADSTLVRTVETGTVSGEPKATVAEVTLPEGTRQMKLRAKQKGVRLFGVSLEAGVTGVIYESIGVPGSTSEAWLFPDPRGFGEQLRHRAPLLLVTMLGGNDALALYQNRKTLEEIEKNTRAFIVRLKDSSPTSDCLIISPMDAVKAKANGEMISKSEVPKIIEIQRRVAGEQGCGFWDMYASMGGVGAIERWFKADLINADLIHPRAAGGDLLGEMLAEALMNAYDARMVLKASMD